MKHRLLLPIALLLIVVPATAHEDLLGTHYVSINGVDQGDCRHAHQPCRSIAYAQSQALQGDTIKIAEGTYFPNDRELASLFYSPIKLIGGFSVADEFATQSAIEHPTYLVGSRRWETAARGRGFDLIATDNTQSQIGISTAHATTADCVQGSADVFPCRNVDLLAHIPLSAFSSKPSSAADVWGFVDRNDDREYALVGLSNGTAIVDVTIPTAPREVTVIPSFSSLWHEPTVYQYFDNVANRYRAYAYVSTEARGGSVEIIDLSGLPNSATLIGRLGDMLSAHTVYVANVEYSGNTSLSGHSPFLVVAGSNSGGGALRMYSLANPAAPQLVTAPAAGYMHDSTSLIVTDGRTAQCASGHNPCEVLVDYNETTVDLWDVTNKSSPLRLSSTSYPTARYVHSGWPTDDGRYVFVHDELDELRAGINTQIYTLDISNLTAPTIRTSYVGPTNSTDHNGYVKGDRLYVSHYRRGLVVFDISDPNNLKEVGSLDTFTNPSANVAGTDGAWGVYPFLASGSILVSDIDNGLFILGDHTRNLNSRPGRVGFAQTTLSVAEDQGDAIVTVRRVDGRQNAASVQYGIAGGTATLGGDVQSVTGTLTWTDGDDSDKSIRIPIVNDTEVESSESFSVTLTSVSGAQLDGANSMPVTITDNDSTSSSSDHGGGELPLLVSLALAILLVARRFQTRYESN